MFLGDEFDATAMCHQSPSPIRVDQVKPLKSGDRTFELSFFHANYPEGVQTKTYSLQTIHRGENGLLVQSTDHSPTRFIYVTDLTADWLQHHFPQLSLESNSIQDALR